MLGKGQSGNGYIDGIDGPGQLPGVCPTSNPPRLRTTSYSSPIAVLAGNSQTNSSSAFSLSALSESMQSNSSIVIMHPQYEQEHYRRGYYDDNECGWLCHPKVNCVLM